jgi:type VI secretion system protein
LQARQRLGNHQRLQWQLPRKPLNPQNPSRKRGVIPQRLGLSSPLVSACSLARFSQQQMQSRYRENSPRKGMRRYRSIPQTATAVFGITSGSAPLPTSMPQHFPPPSFWSKPASALPLSAVRPQVRGVERACRAATLVAVLGAAIELTACATPSWLCYFPAGVKKVTIITSPDTNADRAIAVDLVFVTQDLPAQEIGKLSAHQYFVRRRQLLLDFPQTMQIRSWELAPGQLVKNADASPPCNLVQTYVFAGYGSEGDHRATLSGASSVVLTLGPDDFTIQQ